MRFVVGCDLEEFKRYYRMLARDGGWRGACGFTEELGTSWEKVLVENSDLLLVWRENDRIVGHAIWHETSTDEHREGVIKMSNKRVGLGSEHPLCDSIQLGILILYFAVWGIDSLSYFAFGFSTVLVEFTSFPLLLLPAFVTWSFGIYLAFRSHEVIFGKATGRSKLNDSGVYSWVRHPMYQGTLLFCLGFLFIVPSLLSFAVWIAFLIFYDKMATYEEKDLIRILGEEYVNYQKRVPKWGLRLQGRKPEQR